MQKHGMVETTELVECIISLANAVGLAYQDKKFDLTDLALFITPITKLPAALSGMEKIPDEWMEMDDLEKDKLIMKIKALFELPDEKLEKNIERAIHIGIMLGDLITDLYKQPAIPKKEES